MPHYDLEGIPEREVVPGFFARFVHSENNTLAFWRIEEGAGLPPHSHHHEQVSIVLEGEFELTVDGVPHVLTPGKVFVIPGDVPHGGRALTPCRVLDTFSPVREEYK